MNQVSKPMQIALGAVLVFAVLWFVALRPKEPAIEPVAATPATPAATTPASDAGGDPAQTGLGKAVETAKNGAAAADASTAAKEQQTGEETSTPAATTAPAADATQPAAQGTPAAAASKDAAPKGESSNVSAAQRRADSAIRSIKRDLAARRAVVVLIWSKSGKEDTVLYRRIKNDIDRRGGRVRTYFIPVAQVGRYDGLLAGLAVGQTPSTIVIAPNNEAKVLGGLTSTERIDRLTSAALQIKPAATAP
ncbi:MAG: hypothetical protein JHD16_07545 [Solirubrobacteraceae bacterium]|nr:hypothetical protein [Solirubrobacteraceae bacterium]